ncbi:MAG: metallophosphoesterase [Lachnospiraceae bacterium]|nr:metallophosphoesterase [Lachnospiraceae bacterium]
MRYLIVSDSHGWHKYLDQVIFSVGHIDGMFHLGDVQDRETDIEAEIDCPLHIIAGNNDFGFTLSDEKIVFLGSHRIFMTHGHAYGVHYDYRRLKMEAGKRKCDVVMFGHTHVPYLAEEDGITLVNPGSISLPRQPGREPTYMIMEMDNQGKLTFQLHKIIV